MIQEFTLSGMKPVFEERIATLAPSSAKAYRKSLLSLSTYIGKFSSPDTPLSIEILADWIAWLRISGISRLTALHYLENVTALLNSSIVAECAEALIGGLPALRREIADIPEEEFIIPRSADLNTLRLSFSRLPERPGADPAGDLLKCALLNGTNPEALLFERQDNGRLYPEGADRFIYPHRSPRRTHLFPLNQSRTTAAMVERNVTRRLISLFRMEGERAKEMAAEGRNLGTLFGLAWQTLLTECGASPSTAAATVARAIPSFRGVRPSEIAEISPEEAEEWQGILRERLTDGEAGWYAFHLRPGAAIEDVERIKEDSDNRIASLFYPQIPVARREGKRIQSVKRPLLPEIFFLRTHGNHLPALMPRLAEAAWCYRVTARPTSPPARIPRREMERFQQAIGIFTPDTEIYPAGTLEVKPGDSVTVIGGPFSGHSATVIDASSYGRPVYSSTSAGDSPSSSPSKGDQGSEGEIIRLILPGTNGIEWRISLDSRLTRKN